METSSSSWQGGGGGGVGGAAAVYSRLIYDPLSFLHVCSQVSIRAAGVRSMFS